MKMFFDSSIISTMNYMGHNHYKLIMGGILIEVTLVNRSNTIV
jgi:hypothetical protein